MHSKIKNTSIVLYMDKGQSDYTEELIRKKEFDIKIRHIKFEP